MITQDKIIKMAAEACDPNTICARDGEWWTLKQEELERFFRAAYAAGAAAEREACAKACDEQVVSKCLAPLEIYRTEFIAAAIRARGEK